MYYEAKIERIKYRQDIIPHFNHFKASYYVMTTRAECAASHERQKIFRVVASVAI